QYALAAHRHRLAAGRQLDPDRIRAFLPRPGRAEPDELGFSDRRRPDLFARRLVARDPSRNSDPAHRAGDQPRRRRSQRRPQSEAARPMSDVVLAIDGLTVALPPWADRPNAVDGVSLQVFRKEILCVVGESGSGKSVMAKSVLRLLPEPPMRVTAGRITY